MRTNGEVLDWRLSADLIPTKSAEDSFLLALAILLDLIGQYEAVHGQGGENVADIDQRKDIDEQ